MTTRQQFEQFFDLADKDHSGTLTVEELVQAILKCNPKESRAKLEVYSIYFAYIALIRQFGQSLHFDGPIMWNDLPRSASH